MSIVNQIKNKEFSAAKNSVREYLNSGAMSGITDMKKSVGSKIFQKQQDTK